MAIAPVRLYGYSAFLRDWEVEEKEAVAKVVCGDILSDC